MHARVWICFVFLTFTLFDFPKGTVVGDSSLSLKSASSFSGALEALQLQINYTFKDVGLLRQAMTHSSYSLENNQALSVLGEDLIEASVALKSVVNDIDISAEDLTKGIAEVSNVESSCAVDGMQLGLEKIIRVASNTDSSTPSVVCGAFRAVFGAIAIDAGSSDVAGRVFLEVHSYGASKAVA